MNRYFIIGFLLMIQTSINGSYKIFIIHGYGSSRVMMKKIDKSLRKENFITENYGYKSVSEDIDTLGKRLYEKIKILRLDTISFVTHSMGSLVVRAMVKYSIDDKEFPVIYRIVMIAPPNEGAELADFYSSFSILKKILGPNIEHMKTDSDSYVSRLPKLSNSEIGIIAGARGGKQGYNIFIEGDNNGVLTPKRTKLSTEKDFIIVKGEHNILTQKKYVCRLIINFLKFGLFKPNGNID